MNVGFTMAMAIITFIITISVIIIVAIIAISLEVTIIIAIINGITDSNFKIETVSVAIDDESFNEATNDLVINLGVIVITTIIQVLL